MAARSGRRASTTTGSGTTFPPAITRPEARRRLRRHHADPDAHRTGRSRKVADVLLEDDRLIEVSCQGRRSCGNGWRATISTSSALRPTPGQAIKAARPSTPAAGSFDWLHINSATYVGPNQWFDAGRPAVRPEQRHHQQPRSQPAGDRRPRRQDRLAARSRLQRSRRSFARSARSSASIMPTSFPKGLPGAGNLLVFDNGGSSGYGFAESDRARRPRRLCARDVAGARDQSGDAGTGVVLHEPAGSSAPTSAARSGCPTATR